jgi:hypothetical protein
MVSVTVFPLGMCNSFPAQKEPIQSRRGQQFQLGFFVVDTYLFTTQAFDLIPWSLTH